MLFIFICLIAVCCSNERNHWNVLPAFPFDCGKSRENGAERVRRSCFEDDISWFNDFLLNSEISVLTMAIIARTAFGMTIQDLGGKDDPFIKNAKRLVDRKQFKSPSVILLCKWSINRFQIFCFKRCYNTLNSFYRLTSGQTFEVDDEKILPNGELELLLQHSRNHVQRTSK